jgi:hypothetical protein
MSPGAIGFTVLMVFALTPIGLDAYWRWADRRARSPEDQEKGRTT